MSEKNTGGPAFPLAFQELDGSGTPRMEMYAHDGMTLRDYFAAKAMQAIIASSRPGCTGELLAHDAINSYRYADAMLKARKA